jgi:D-arabinose 5-phosphate isomerase GutQ
MLRSSRGAATVVAITAATAASTIAAAAAAVVAVADDVKNTPKAKALLATRKPVTAGTSLQLFLHSTVAWPI